MWREMRRFKQQLADDEALEILRDAPRGVLAVLGDEGYPYTVPMNFVLVDGKLYFHCAPTGHKIDAIRACDKASFNVLDEGTQNPGEWWWHFRSVTTFGRIRMVDDPELKLTTLRALGEKYFPPEHDLEADLAKNGDRVEMLELTIEHLTGKCVQEK